MPAADANIQGKYWVFTLNNPTEEEQETLRSQVQTRLPDSSVELTYLSFSREVGENGTPHLQGYLELSRRLRRRTISSLFGPRLHLERRRGTQAEAITYCKKDQADGTPADWEEHGERTTQTPGRRTDLDTIKEFIDDGHSERDLAEEHFSKWVVYRRSFAKYKELITPNGIRANLKVYVLWGEPGTGKTRYVYEKYPDVFSVPSSNLQWFDGYNGEATVLFDDYRGTGDESDLLKLLDIYPMQVPVKGGFTHWRPSRIFITSNLQPPFGHDAIGAPLARRLHHTLRITMDTTMEQIDGAFQEQGEQ